MEKLFFEVFPTLKVSQEMRTLFERVEVTKVVTNSDRDYLHVHILSRHLIAKTFIYTMETAIKEQLFSLNHLQIHIIERYTLSELYTPENILNEIRDSILLELKERSVVEYNMFAKTNITFENEQLMNLEFEDTIVARERAEAIVSLLKEIYIERCCVPVEIQISYRRIEKSKIKEHNEMKLQQEVNAI